MQQTALGVAPSVRERLAHKEDAVAAAHLSFARAAELEDQGELVPAATWQTLGKAICVLISTEHETRIQAYVFSFQRELRENDVLGPISRECGEIAFAIEQRVEHISREINLLSDAGTKGGSISTRTTQWFANVLSNEFNALRDQICRLYALALFDMPCSKAPKSAATFIRNASCST